MSLECFRQLTQLLPHTPAVLATVIHVKGSVPREAGAKMILTLDRIFFTIGGGAGEGKVIQQAKTVLEIGEPQLVQIDLTGSPNQLQEGICGGKMQIWLQRWQGSESLTLAQQIVDLLQSGHSLTLTTPLSPHQSPFLTSAHPLIPPSPHPLTPPPTYTETLHPPPTLLIIGAGHVGEQLAKVAHLAGFQIWVQDDRPDWANPDRYPQANQIFREPIAQILDCLQPQSQLYVALVTRGYLFDLEALTVLLQKQIPCCYLGMIGSKKRVRQVYQAIEQTGIEAAKLKTLYAPIGLDIGALTPEEIAVSIVAELIMVRRGGSGRSLSCRL
ncbi:XdhC family protein [Leptolyngbya sp. GB1-A1]|uniref:XdhC family protein n=1 Tax=Leptolyngbya sp. GB1-A1 TaxID=2933908 RepID=UPI0032985F89